MLPSNTTRGEPIPLPHPRRPQTISTRIPMRIFMPPSAVFFFQRSYGQSVWTFLLYPPTNRDTYGVATIRRLLQIVRLFCRILSLIRALLHKRPVILRSLLIVATPWVISWGLRRKNKRYRMAKTHRIPYLYRSFSAKSDLYLVALLWKMICNFKDPMSLRHSVSLAPRRRKKKRYHQRLRVVLDLDRHPFHTERRCNFVTIPAYKSRHIGDLMRSH